MLQSSPASQVPAHPTDERLPDMPESPPTKVSASTSSSDAPLRVRALLHVNGSQREVYVEPRRTLLDALRQDLHLTGAKPGCNMGQCGACTVLLDGEAVYSCLLLAVECQGHEITTIEGLAAGERARPCAAGVHRARRAAMWLLHAGADTGAESAACAQSASQRRGDRHAACRAISAAVAPIQRFSRLRVRSRAHDA